MRRAPSLFFTLVLFAFASGGVCELPPDAAYGRACDTDDDCGADYRCNALNVCVSEGSQVVDGGDRPHDSGPAPVDGGEGEGDGGGGGCSLPCGAGQACSDQGCAAGCLVEGTFYSDGEADPARPCWRCNADVDTAAFVPTELDAVCEDNDACTSDTTCDGVGGCVAASSVDCSSLDEACAVGACDPADGSCGLVPESVGLDCGSGVVCDGAGGCLAGCFVDGVLYDDGEPSPAASCLGCVPATSTTAFSPLAADVECSGGLFCDGAGSCGPSCVIDQVTHPNGSDDPIESCRFCDSALSLSEWQDKPDDAPCADDENVCTETLCRAGACTSLPLPSGAPCGGDGVCDGAGACSGPQTVLVVSSGDGVGAVTSAPAGIDCGATCEADFEFGTDVTLSATPDSASSAFSGWSGDCSGAGPCTLTMTRARALTASFTLLTRTLEVLKDGKGTGSVSSTIAGINCGATCSAGFPHGTEVTLNAIATSGTSLFAGWSGACSGSSSCVVTLDQARSVTATFHLVQRTLGVTTSGDGSVSSSPAAIDCGATCSASFDHGAVVTLTATPGTNYALSSWSGACSGAGSTCDVTMDQARDVHASFVLVKRTLSVSRSGNGVVTSTPAGISCGSGCGADFDHGASVSLTATPDAFWAFTGWSGACSGDGACSVSMTQARSVTATFAAVQRTLSVSTSGNGSLSSNPAGISCGSACSASFDHGTSVTLTPTADANHDFSSWSGDCSGNAGCTVSMTQARSVTANFVVEQRLLSVNRTGNGTVTSNIGSIDCGSSCSDSYGHGSVVLLTATPDANHQFNGWSGACNAAGTCSVTMTQARTVGATFALQQRTLTVAKNGDGYVSSNIGSIDCGDTCDDDYNHGTVVTLTASASPGSYFQSWSGGGCTGNGTCQVTLNAATTVTADFEPLPTFTLHVNIFASAGSGAQVSSSDGSINCNRFSSPCQAQYLEGEPVELFASGGGGIGFWSGDCSGDLYSPCNLTMDGDRYVNAEFQDDCGGQFCLPE